MPKSVRTCSECEHDEGLVHNSEDAGLDPQACAINAPEPERCPLPAALREQHRSLPGQS